MTTAPFSGAAATRRSLSRSIASATPPPKDPLASAAWTCAGQAQPASKPSSWGDAGQQPTSRRTFVKTEAPSDAVAQASSRNVPRYQEKSGQTWSASVSDAGPVRTPRPRQSRNIASSLQKESRFGGFPGLNRDASAQASGSWAPATPTYQSSWLPGT